MAKAGMKRPEPENKPSKDTQAPVPEIAGKAKSGNEKARPM